MAAFPLAAFAAVLVATVVAVIVDSQFWFLPIVVLVLGVAFVLGDRALKRNEARNEQDRMSGLPPR